MPTLNDYQTRIVGFLAAKCTENKEAQLEHACLGLSGESGEFNDLVKKWKFQGHDLDEQKAKLELGDILFSVAEAADALGTSLEDIALLNLEKLTKRYPKGHFTVEDSKAKKDEGFVIGTSGTYNSTIKDIKVTQ